MRADAQVLKGHLQTLLLASLENGPQHGYAVKEALGARSDARFRPAHRHHLPGPAATGGRRADQGHLGRRPAGGAAVPTKLTPAGRRRLAGDRAAWRDFASAVSAILEPAR